MKLLPVPYVHKKLMYLRLKYFLIPSVIISTLTISCLRSTPVVQAEDIELSLPAIQAFGIGTKKLVKSAKSIDTQAFNQRLMEAHENQAEWSNNFVQIGLQFIGGAENHRYQHISVVIPGEWEPGTPLTSYARVTIENGGWLDDSVAGNRYILWIVQGEQGELKVQRALYANLCYRPFDMYSAGLCP